MINSIWKDNLCIIYAYKSDRKNAKIVSDVTMRHLITHNDGKVSDERVLQYFIDVIGQLVTDIKYSSKTINLTTYLSIDTNTHYLDANGFYYEHKHTIRIDNKRKKFYSIEECINYLYDILLLVYPYTALDINTIYGNASIRYFINLYYRH